MQNQSEKKRRKKKWIALVLTVVMMFAAAMPASASSETSSSMSEINTGPEQTAGTRENSTETPSEQQNAGQAGQGQNAEPESSEDAAGENNSSEKTEESNPDSSETNEEMGAENQPTQESGEESRQAVGSDSSAAKANTIRLAAAASNTVSAPDPVGTIERKNEWQIVSEEYAGTDQVYKKGFDLDGNGSNDIFYQKNVIPTGVENEFRVYMGISKRMTWDEILAKSDFAVSNSNGFHKQEIGTQYSGINKGNPSILHPGKTGQGNDLEATVHYYRGGKIVHTYKGWYYYENTPSASNGTGFIYLKALGIYFLACKTIALSVDKNGGSLVFDIDLDAMEKKNIYFSVDDIVADSVQDSMGDYITYEDCENSDGTVSFSGSTLTWKPESNGVTGTEVKEDGGLTGYYYNIHQMVYKVHLKAEQEGFHSCAQNMNSAVGDAESYPVNQKAVLNCHMGSYTGNPEFQVPYVRGLLYDLEFRKIVAGSEIPLADISFTVTRQPGGSTAAEQVQKTDRQTTGQDGWMKFHNLPWGTYSLQELAGTDSSFQSIYLDGSGLGTPVTVQIGKVINGSALVQDHGSGHSADLQTDLNNMLLLYNGDGIFENTPNTARITIKKVVNEYDSVPSDLKNLSYTITAESFGNSENAVYEMPDKDDMEFRKLNEKTDLKHEETVEYTLVVPAAGGRIYLNEHLPDRLGARMKFGSVKVEKNGNSTDPGSVSRLGSLCGIDVFPGNDLTITYTNLPVGLVYIHKLIDNYQAPLADDAFILRVTSAEDNGQSVNAEVVLKHDEYSPDIEILKTTTLQIAEVLPKEYTQSGITYEKYTIDAETGDTSVYEEGTCQGGQIVVHPGENVEITVHNSYSGEPYFHVSDAVKNAFLPPQR